MQYPPASLEQAVQVLFLEGGTSKSAWSTKLATFLYFLLDAGHKATLTAFRQVILLLVQLLPDGLPY